MIIPQQISTSVLALAFAALAIVWSNYRLVKNMLRLNRERDKLNDQLNDVKRTVKTYLPCPQYDDLVDWCDDLPCLIERLCDEYRACRTNEEQSRVTIKRLEQQLIELGVEEDTEITMSGSEEQ